MLTEVMGAISVHWVFGSVRFYRWILALMSLNGIVLAGENLIFIGLISIIYLYRGSTMYEGPAVIRIEAMSKQQLVQILRITRSFYELNNSQNN